MSELKPCPFCGGKASQEFFSEAGGGWSIFCDGGHASAATCVTKIKAIAAWNTRPTDPDLAESAARLRGLLEQATPGPWKWDGYSMSEVEPYYRDIISASGGRIFSEYSSDPAQVDISDDDAALIVEAINALPALLDAVEGRPMAAPEQAPEAASPNCQDMPASIASRRPDRPQSNSGGR